MGLFTNAQGKWKLASGTWTDESGNSYTLSASVSSPTATTGHSSDANGAANLASASSQYLYIADASCPNLNITGSFSLSLWVKPASTGAYQTLLSKWTDTSQRSYLLQINSANTLTCYLSYDGTNFTAKTSTTTVSSSTWYHICIVYNGSTLRMFINGTEEGSPFSYSSGIYNSTADFRLGARGGGTLYCLNGVIDDVVVWNRAITTEEISVLYSAGADFYFAPANVSGTLKNTAGVAIDCSTYNVRVNAYYKNNTNGVPAASSLISSADGTYEITSGIIAGIKYLITYEYEGNYSPLGQVDIAGAEFQTSILS